MSARVKIPVRRGALDLKDGSHYSYKHMGERKRRTHLRAWVEQDQRGWALSLFRALGARRTLGQNRMTQSEYARLTSDMDYVKRKYQGTKWWQREK